MCLTEQNNLIDLLGFIVYIFGLLFLWLVFFEEEEGRKSTPARQHADFRPKKALNREWALRSYQTCILFHAINALVPFWYYSIFQEKGTKVLKTVAQYMKKIK